MEELTKEEEELLVFKCSCMAFVGFLKDFKEYVKNLSNAEIRSIAKELIEERDVCIKKVKMLHDRAREEANKQGLDENDLVFIRTTIQSGSLPKYELEKIEGSPIIYLENKIRLLKHK